MALNLLHPHDASTVSDDSIQELLTGYLNESSNAGFTDTGDIHIEFLTTETGLMKIKVYRLERETDWLPYLQIWKELKGNGGKSA